MRLIDRIWQFHKQHRLKHPRYLFSSDSSSTASSSSATVTPPPPKPKHTKRFPWLSRKRWLPSTPAAVVVPSESLPRVDVIDHDLLSQCIQLALAPTEMNELNRPKRWSMGMIEGSFNTEYTTTPQRRRSIMVKCPPTSYGRFLSSIPEVENDHFEIPLGFHSMTTVSAEV
ncbi:hypothetical protein EC973_005716 [Apophysomyces ossiformis]|uniref:Uncharacterized protein n=1 Tax=Apophysomyces ossiformis TaxID=679940 RepID=A0A8H7BWY1_9FUNG|nr:hypothetical protein EC973_005716 [Apophysomyces ossiformis]